MEQSTEKINTIIFLFHSSIGIITNWMYTPTGHCTTSYTLELNCIICYPYFLLLFDFLCSTWVYHSNCPNNDKKGNTAPTTMKTGCKDNHKAEESRA